MKKRKEQERPNWYSSHYRGEWDFDNNKQIIHNKKPLRCPYCGHDMDFASPIFYQYKQSDWYWFCPECGLRLPNSWGFKKEDLDKARKRWRKHLLDEMNKAEERYKGLKNLYKKYGLYFTPEEKRERLIETIEEHK